MPGLQDNNNRENETGRHLRLSMSCTNVSEACSVMKSEAAGAQGAACMMLINCCVQRRCSGFIEQKRNIPGIFLRNIPEYSGIFTLKFPEYSSVTKNLLSLKRTRALRPFINKMERTVLVSPVYSSNLVRVQKTTAGNLASAAIRDAREGRPSTRAEFLNAEANPSSRHECERQASVIKFFFDYDDGDTYHQRPADEELDVLQRELSSEVECVLKEGAGVNREETPYDIHVAFRHGYSTAKSTGETRYKLSLRFFVSGLRTDMYSIRSAVRLAALKKHGDLKRARFDLSVYSKNRRMCMILGIKDKTDLRMLMPVAPGRERPLG